MDWSSAPAFSWNCSFLPRLIGSKYQNRSSFSDENERLHFLALHHDEPAKGCDGDDHWKGDRYPVCAVKSADHPNYLGEDKQHKKVREQDLLLDYHSPQVFCRSDASCDAN